MTSITPFLWFHNNVPEALLQIGVPNAKVETVNRFMATFELEGQKFNALNGGPKYKFNEAKALGELAIERGEQVVSLAVPTLFSPNMLRLWRSVTRKTYADRDAR
jgi:predicted 3-demethylubiquinone-9 3-methyltransferase (glyoxalase superfamily)